jgi:hypothetical protein
MSEAELRSAPAWIRLPVLPAWKLALSVFLKPPEGVRELGERPHLLWARRRLHRDHRW